VEQPGEPPQPEPPARQLPTPPQPDRPDRPDGRAFALVAVLTLVLIAAVIAWMINRHDGRDALVREEQRFPSATTLAATATTPAPTTAPVAPPPTTPVAVAPPPTTVPPTPAPTPAPTPPPTTVPVAPATTVPGAAGATTTTTAPVDAPYIAELVPDVAAFAEYLSSPEQAKAQIDQLLASGRHDVATPGPARSICAAVRMGQPLAVKSRWERDGRRIASSDLGRRDTPGFGECLGNDGEPLVNGSYQYVAIDSEGHESAAGGIVIGAARIDQPLTNDGDEPVCLVRIAPSASRYFEVYVYTAQPITRGAQVSIAVAAERQDVETVGCAGGDDVLATFSFDPAPGTVQSLRP
jgi:hypothetical protein